MPMKCNSIFNTLVEAIEEFESHGVQFHHTTLIIDLPNGFFRLGVLSRIDRFEPKQRKVMVRFCQSHLELKFHFLLSKTSHGGKPILNLVKHEECFDHYEINGKYTLSSSDARNILLFLLTIFQGDNFIVREQCNARDMYRVADEIIVH